jgi:hypothetical protein
MGESCDGGEFDDGLVVEKSIEISALRGIEEDDEKTGTLQAFNCPLGGEAFQTFAFEHKIENDPQLFFCLAEKNVSVIEKHFSQDGGMGSVFISHLERTLGLCRGDDLQNIVFDDAVKPAIILFSMLDDHAP